MGSHTFFGDVIARDVWEPIHEGLAIAMRMEIHVLGPDGRDLCPPQGLTRFRHLLHASASFEEQSLATRRELIARADAANCVVLEETFTGRLRFALPIRYGGDYVAMLTGGGVIEKPLPPSRINSLASEFGVDRQQLLEASRDLPVVGRGACEAAASVVGALLSQIVEARRTRERARIRARRLQVLSEISHTVVSSLDTLHILETVVDVIPQILHVKAVVVALFDKQRECLQIQASRGVSDQFQAVRIDPGRGLIGTVANTGLPLNVPDMLADPRNAYLEHDRREGFRALLAAPLLDGGQVIGVIAGFAGEPYSFTGGDEQMFSSLADYAATALRNARLYEQLNRAYRELGVATRRLHETQERLLHSDQLATIGRMAGEAAHEMKNTLGGIIGVASTVRDQYSELTPDEIRELLAAVAEEGWRLRDTIETVRGYSKPAEVGAVPTNLRQTIDEAVRLLQFDQALGNPDISVECDPTIQFQGDRNRLKQVLINLLRNGIESLDGLTDRVPHIAITGAVAESWAVITVKDNGAGIPPERIERIWEPFYTTKGDAGTGLGLDNVRQIVQAQGGEIEVSSEPGSGTVFTVRLPLAVEEKSAT